MAVGEEAHALATRITRHTDTDIVTCTDAGPVNRETPAANLAGNFLHGVMTGFSILRDGKCRNAAIIRRMNEPNASRRFRGRFHAASVYHVSYNCPSPSESADGTIEGSLARR